MPKISYLGTHAENGQSVSQNRYQNNATMKSYSNVE